MLMSDLIEYSHTYAKTIWGFCQKGVISDKVTDSESFTFKNNNNKNIDDNNNNINNDNNKNNNNNGRTSATGITKDVEIRCTIKWIK